MEGSCLLIEQGLTRAGTDLAKQLVELFVTREVVPTKLLVQKMMQIEASFAHVSKSGCRGEVDSTIDEDMQTFLLSAIKWTAKQGRYPHGNPDLNHAAAKVYLRQGDFYKTCLRYVFARQPEEFASFLFARAKMGYAGEYDLFLGKAVLHLLAVENVNDASRVMEQYTSLCKSEVRYKETPLINMLKLLVETVYRGKKARPLFELLQKRYQKSIDRDPVFQSCMGRIGFNYFGIPMPKAGGVLGMLESLMGGGQK